ncbi:unnamed protein product [Alopecurus aequalis]
MVSPSKKKRRRRDRLSDLPDDLLGHVLSFLPAEEAGRTAVLSCRWRRALELVETISFKPLPTIDVDDENRRLVDRVTNALVARRRGCGDMPLRCFRVAMHRYAPPDNYALDKWLSYTCSHGVQELRLETAMHGHAYTGGCYIVGTDGYDDESSSDSSDDLDGTDGYDNLDGNDGYNDLDGNDSYDSSWDSDGYDDSDGSSHYDSGHSDSETPTRYDVPACARLQYDISPELFCCATLRALHLVSCSLPPRQLPSTIHLPSLETLSLTKITYTSRQISGENMQRVISCCPRLADLTLEACRQMTDITVKRLTSFAVRCCHRVHRVTIDDTWETLQAFEYRGDASSCEFTLVGDAPRRIASAKIQVCSSGKKKKKKIDFEGLRKLLLLLVNARHLHLGWPDVSDEALWTEEYDDFHTLHFPGFHNLKMLELGCHCTDPRVGDRVAGVLRQTPNLTALVIGFESWDQNYGVLDVSKVAVPCLRERVKEMRVEQYDEGVKLQKQLLKWLLGHALVDESVRVVLKRGRYTVPDYLVNEIRSWAPNPATRITLS